MNLTQGGDTILYWPDTVLIFYFVGMPQLSNEEHSFQVFQNYPNPMTDQTMISLFVPEKDKVNLIITDILGRIILKTERSLEKGIHSFRFTSGNEKVYFFIALWRGMSRSIKILHNGGHSDDIVSLEYTGSEFIALPPLKGTEDIQDFTFTLSDELLYIGYANYFRAAIVDAPEDSKTYTFNFATNIPCIGTPDVSYEGQVYSTIQIANQCWLKENLNVGTMIDGLVNMEENGVIEKYCYNDEPDSCAKYGGLYQWNEMMQYFLQEGARGICPPGWHLPSDKEWKLLEGVVDSQYGIGDPEWDGLGERGLDAGFNLKTVSV